MRDAADAGMSEFDLRTLLLKHCGQRLAVACRQITPANQDHRASANKTDSAKVRFDVVRELVVKRWRGCESLIVNHDHVAIGGRPRPPPRRHRNPPPPLGV